MKRRRGLAVSAVALLLVLAGCSAPVMESRPAPGVSGGPDVAVPNADFDDPDSDVLGWEGGYWYNESVDVDQSDGLTDAEMRAYVARAMARVEYIRGEEFQKRVPVSVISREEYRNRSSGGSAGEPTEYDQWNDQVWEALFVTGESQSSGSAISGTRSAAVAGFYSPTDDEIKVITGTPESPTINNATLVHELVHALQDQRYDLTKAKYGGETQDAQLATDGLIEGDAKYVEQRYADRCGGAWECVATPSSSGDSGDGGGDMNLGIFLTIFQPYSDGPVYVHDLVTAEGWSAVDERFENPPESTEQIIHRTGEEPTPINYRDRAQNGWGTFEKQGEGGSDTVGEASMYVMFWYQARNAGADTIDPRSISSVDSPYDTYNYDAEPSAGWANDRLFPYQKQTSAGSQYGYVWATEWDTERDAREFQRAYRAILDAHDAEQRAANTYVVPDGQFADAFRVTRSGTRVTIVNGPTVADLDDIRPRAA
ncbi:Hvo_1808 family surface protein [Halobellus inordinatus]|uniref:Hvo_1808 family surface protein n=1 Tax=Halobellus inordinatus TaxID=1126236 RepID=UPI002108D539|nr:Hvo_1808 family surface protein [Halobellus inordinatus]